MRNYSGIFEFSPSLMGTMSVITGTAVGAPIDRFGFADCLGIVCAGGLQGSTGATVTLSLKVQESAIPEGTGAHWTDITNEAVSNGSFSFSDITLGDSIAGGTTTATWIPYETVKKYARLTDGNRKRYLRMHATLNGTVGLGPKICAGFLLGRSNDTAYIVDPVVQGSGNVELTKLL